MIIIMKQGTTHEHVEELSQHIERWNVKANPIYGEGHRRYRSSRRHRRR